MTGNGQEVEVKLAVPSAAEACRLLQNAGYQVRRERVFERNDLYDTPDLRLRNRRELIRLRSAGGENLLTYKGPPVAGRHKSRPEVEVAVSNAAAMESILGKLGLSLVFRYEKYRTEYDKPGEPGHVTVDETPIGDFLELEGPGDWIDRTAAALGFAQTQYITASYAALYREHCSRTGETVSNMVF
ncbi:MAG: class IV adenylate cyclase [Bryobacteraceae bacterium]|nr:class IV adenylate cyclase [Bryobacteraceae bacterium]